MSVMFLNFFVQIDIFLHNYVTAGADAATGQVVNGDKKMLFSL